MMCDLCNERPADIFLEQRSGSSCRKINLCAACASKKGIAAPAVSAEQKNLDSVFREIFEKKTKSSPDFKRLCPGCGKSLGEIKLSGFSGCPECYFVFSNEIKSLLNPNGIETKYTGTLPHRIKDFSNDITDRADLQRKLEEAVSKEDYEKAAVYRDFLRAIEKKSVVDGEEI